MIETIACPRCNEPIELESDLLNENPASIKMHDLLVRCGCGCSFTVAREVDGKLLVSSELTKRRICRLIALPALLSIVGFAGLVNMAIVVFSRPPAAWTPLAVLIGLVCAGLGVHFGSMCWIVFKAHLAPPKQAKKGEG